MSQNVMLWSCDAVVCAFGLPYGGSIFENISLSHLSPAMHISCTSCTPGWCIHAQNAVTASYASHWGNEKDLRLSINNNKQISYATKNLDFI